MTTASEQNPVLAQINIAQPVSSLQSKQLQGFVSRLEEINALAEESEGFVWRLKDENGDGTTIMSPEFPDVIINMSTWRNVECLRAYVFDTAHLEVLKMKSNWFVRRGDTTSAMWWRLTEDAGNGETGQSVAASPPSIEEGLAKLAELEEHGSTPFAFTFADPWPAPFSLSTREELAAADHQFLPVLETDLDELATLLESCGLVADDLQASWGQGAYAYFIKEVDGRGRIVAAGGLEPRRTSAALRSLAVLDAGRGRGVGAALVTVLERLARARGLQTLYLLTESAEGFFLKYGYATTDRNGVPRAIGQLAQFTSLCPDSAACLVKQL